MSLRSHIVDCLFHRPLPNLASPPRAPISHPPCSHLHPHGHPTLPSPGRVGSELGPSPIAAPRIQSPLCLLPRTLPPCPPSRSPAEGLRREAEDSRGESLSISFIPSQSGLYPLPGAKIQRYIQPAAATGHVSPLLGYRDPKINPSQPD